MNAFFIIYEKTTLSSESTTFQRSIFLKHNPEKMICFRYETLDQGNTCDDYQCVKVYALHKFKSGSVLIMVGTSFVLTPNFLKAKTAEKNVKS